MRCGESQLFHTPHHLNTIKHRFEAPTRLQETRKTPKAPAEVENPIWLPLNAHFHQAKFS